MVRSGIFLGLSAEYISFLDISCPVSSSRIDSEDVSSAVSGSASPMQDSLIGSFELLDWYMIRMESLGAPPLLFSTWRSMVSLEYCVQIHAAEDWVTKAVDPRISSIRSIFPWFVDDFRVWWTPMKAHLCLSLSLNR